MLDEKFYAHMIYKNNEIGWATEGYEQEESAHHAVKKTHAAFGRLFGCNTTDGLYAVIPYTRDSLKPKGWKP